MLKPLEGRRSVASQSVAAFFLRASVALVGLAASVLISRGLGPEGRGEYYLPIVAASTMVVLCKLGVEQANVFLFGSRRVPIGHLFGQNGLLALVTGTLGLALLLQAPSASPALFGSTPRTVLLLAALTVPFSLHSQLSAGLLTLVGRVTWQFWVALLAGLGQLALLGCLFLTGHLEIRLVLAINLANGVFGWTLTVWAAHRRGEPWIRVDRGLLAVTLKHSLVLYVAMVLYWLHFRLDMFMVQGVVGATGLGLYSLSVVLAETVLLATESVAVAVLPRQMDNTLEEAASLALNAARVNGVLALACCGLWVMLGGFAIRVLFGAEFSPAYQPLVALLPGIFFLSMERVCSGPTLRSGRPMWIAGIYGISLLCNAALNMWWIPLWGISGAALASSVSYALEALIVLTWTVRLAKANLIQGLIPGWSDLLVFVGAATSAFDALKPRRLVHPRD